MDCSDSFLYCLSVHQPRPQSPFPSNDIPSINVYAKVKCVENENNNYREDFNQQHYPKQLEQRRTLVGMVIQRDNQNLFLEVLDLHPHSSY